MYTEKALDSAKYRKRIIEETNAWIEARRAECDRARGAHFATDHGSPAAYADSVEVYRRELAEMLGYPLNVYDTFPAPEKEECVRVAEDEYGYIDRLWVEVMPGLFSYGLLFTPRGNGPFPLCVALHGGMGTPEVVSSFYHNSANYNHLVNRIRAKADVMVYAPQLILWRDEVVDDPAYRSSQEYDTKLKQLGSSSAALEIFKIRRALDYITAKRPVDASRIGIAGLSYGGFYTLFTAALDTRFKTALSSCWFNDRYAYPWGDMTWFGSASKMLDAEVASLVCPRPLCIQISLQDEVFDYYGAERSHPFVAANYEKLGLSERFRFSLRDGAHEFHKEDTDLQWFMAHLLDQTK